MVWTHHHILLDGPVSLFLVLRDVLDISRGLAAGRKPTLSPETSFGRVAAALDAVGSRICAGILAGGVGRRRCPDVDALSQTRV